jgi:hypothetical protein
MSGGDADRLEDEMATSNPVASFTKLQSGKWGVRSPGARPLPGGILVVHKKDGTMSEVEVVRVVWSSPADDLHLCETRDTKPRERPAYVRTDRAWRPCGYPGCTRTYCDECDGQGA